MRATALLRRRLREGERGFDARCGNRQREENESSNSFSTSEPILRSLLRHPTPDKFIFEYFGIKMSKFLNIKIRPTPSHMGGIISLCASASISISK
jgi:hypothetical protein